MNTKTFVLLLLVPVFLFAGFYIFDNSGKSVTKETEILGIEATPTEVVVEPADKIEVVHFHATKQCPSCTAVGKFALQTIKERFSEENNSGIIVFKDINMDLPENKEIVSKYHAIGSSLFVNAIRGDKDNIEEDPNVWLLYSNESKYLSYFENKLNTLLGK